MAYRLPGGVFDGGWMMRRKSEKEREEEREKGKSRNEVDEKEESALSQTSVHINYDFIDFPPFP